MEHGTSLCSNCPCLYSLLNYFDVLQLPPVLNSISSWCHAGWSTFRIPSLPGDLSWRYPPHVLQSQTKESILAFVFLSVPDIIYPALRRSPPKERKPLSTSAFNGRVLKLFALPLSSAAAAHFPFRISAKDIRPHRAPRRRPYQALDCFPFHCSRAIFRVVGSLRRRAASSRRSHVAKSTARRSTSIRD